MQILVVILRITHLFRCCAPWLLSGVTVALDWWRSALSSPCGIFARLRSLREVVDGSMEKLLPWRSQWLEKKIHFLLIFGVPVFGGTNLVSFCGGVFICIHTFFQKRHVAAKCFKNFTKKHKTGKQETNCMTAWLHDRSLCVCQGSPLAAWAFFGSDNGEDPVDRTKRLLREADAVFFDVDSTWNRFCS